MPLVEPNMKVAFFDKTAFINTLYIFKKKKRMFFSLSVSHLFRFSRLSLLVLLHRVFIE